MPVSTGHVGNGVLMPRAALEVSGDLRVGSGAIQWSADSIGQYSVAFGLNTLASATHSIAWGSTTRARGDHATAWGSGTTADGVGATAWGSGTLASGLNSTALGNNTIASGLASIAMGNNTSASGLYSTAMGNNTNASGFYSTTTGAGTSASGTYATSMGISTIAQSFASVAIGRFNVGGGSQTNWVDTDPIFEVGIGSSDPSRQNAMVIFKNAAALWLGEYNNTSPAPPPASGAGTRMMWYPEKAAFRAGHVTGNEWDKDSIGDYSIALGLNTMASFTHSTAMGIYTKASGYISTALGGHTVASGPNSIAMGSSTLASGLASTSMGGNTEAIGDYSTAMGENTIASGFRSIAMGESTTASGGTSTAMGTSTDAIGTNSIAMGAYTTASGFLTTAMGNSTSASGDYSTSIGTNTSAESYASVAIGRYNTGGGDPMFWSSTDPIFEIGIGFNSGNKRNAMTVLKNGNIGINTAAPGSHRLYVSSSGTSTNGSTGYFKNTASAGIALAVENSSSSSSDNALLVTNYGSTGNLASFDSYQGSNTWNRRFRFTNGGQGRSDVGWVGGGADYAEFFPKADPSKEYEPGDVISMSAMISYSVESAVVQDPNLMLGVYSTNPVVIGNSSAEKDPDDAVLVGLMGVIPTKICDENGSVRIGDFLTISSTPGVAMKATKSGMVIGRAMEDFSEGQTGMIKVYVEVDWVQFDDKDREIEALQHQTEKLQSEAQVLRSEMNAMRSAMHSETVSTRSEIEELKAIVKALTEDHSQ
jgi:hypothetical protein